MITTIRDRIATSLMSELEIDEIEKHEQDVLLRIDSKLKRQLDSPKRKKSIDELQCDAELARIEARYIANTKIGKIKHRAGFAI